VVTDLRTLQSSRDFARAQIATWPLTQGHTLFSQLA